MGGWGGGLWLRTRKFHAGGEVGSEGGGGGQKFDGWDEN